MSRTIGFPSSACFMVTSNLSRNLWNLWNPRNPIFLMKWNIKLKRLQHCLKVRFWDKEDYFKRKIRFHYPWSPTLTVLTLPVQRCVKCLKDQFFFFNVAFKAWIFRFSEVNRSTVKEEWRTCQRFSHMDKNDWPYRKYGVNGLLIQTNWVQLHWNTSYTYSMIGKKGLQTQKPMPTVSFSATCEFWRVIEPYLLRCYLPMHRSCLLPGFYISYFMLE